MNKPYPLYTLPVVTSLKQMVESQVAENPQRIAFRFREGKGIKEKTIKEFLDDINAFGTWLHHQDIIDAHIALIAPNSYAWIVIYFAVISSGNLIVPIDKDLSIEEKKQLILHSHSRYVFADTKVASVLAKDCDLSEVISMADYPAIIEAGNSFIVSGDKRFLEYAQKTGIPATIVYTSGTTGNKKGVVLTQDNILADINNGCRNFAPDGPSLSVLPYHHMFGLVVALMMLINYRSTVFINTGLKYLMQDFQLSRPQTTMMVPLHIETIYRQIIQKAKRDQKYTKLKLGMMLSASLYYLGIDVRKKIMKEVRAVFGGELEYILVGGAALNPLYEKAFRAFGIDLITAYGATECSPGIAVNRNFYHKDGSVGLPIEHCEVKIANDGEVLVRGENVFSGYYCDQEATEASLIDGWYHSGDLGYLDKDGFLFLTGRKKNLIILSNGENISPEWLENRISAIEGVLEVVVFEEENSIVAEIYADEEHKRCASYFQKRIDELNKKLSPSLRIRNIRMRDEEFPKNSSKKILRHNIVRRDDHV